MPKAMRGLCSEKRFVVRKVLLQGEAATFPPEVFSLILGFPPIICLLLLMSHMSMIIAANTGWELTSGQAFL